MIKNILDKMICVTLILILVLICAFLVTKQTVLNKEYVLKILDDANYYENTYDDITEDLKGYVIEFGLDTSLIDNLFSEEDIKIEINNIIENVYSGNTIEIDTTNLEEKLDVLIDDMVVEYGIKLNNTYKKLINEFKEEIISAYTTDIAYSINALNTISKNINQIINIVNKFLIILLILFILLSIMLIIILKKKAIVRLFNIVLTSGILLIIFRVIIGFRYHYILILNYTFSDTVIYMLDNIAFVILILGISFIVLSLILNVIYNLREEN